MNIDIKGIRKSFGRTEVLKDINMTLIVNKITGLLGNNGSGKTTLMKILAGLYSYDAGELINLPLKNKSLDVCCMLENPAFNGFMTVRQNLKYFVDLSIDKKEEFDYYCKKFDVDFIDKKYSKLSLGMKQKTAIIYMFLKKSKLILLDEITNGLDERVIEVFYKELKKFIIENECYVLISSHKIYELQPICDYVYFLKDGFTNKKIDIVKDLNDNNLKKIVFLNSESCSAFSNIVNNKIVRQIDNEVVFKYDNIEDLNAILKIAVNYDVVQILNDDTSLEKIYTSFLNGD